MRAATVTVDAWLEEAVRGVVRVEGSGGARVAQTAHTSQTIHVRVSRAHPAPIHPPPIQVPKSPIQVPHRIHPRTRRRPYPSILAPHHPPPPRSFSSACARLHAPSRSSGSFCMRHRTAPKGWRKLQTFARLIVVAFLRNRTALKPSLSFQRMRMCVCSGENTFSASTMTWSKCTRHGQRLQCRVTSRSYSVAQLAQESRVRCTRWYTAH